MRITIAEKDEILRKRAEEVTPEEFGTDELRRLALDMAETMVKAKGVGIAAPQVGVSKRLCIIETADGPAALVNPILKPRTNSTALDTEGCLSCPGQEVMVERFRKISVVAKSIDGEDVSFEAEEYLARVIQHENDHLDGILIIDKK